MFKLKVFLVFIGMISLVFGVKFIYDARPIAKKYFSLSDKNLATSGLKVIGFLMMIFGGFIMYFIY